MKKLFLFDLSPFNWCFQSQSRTEPLIIRSSSLSLPLHWNDIKNDDLAGWMKKGKEGMNQPGTKRGYARAIGDRSIASFSRHICADIYVHTSMCYIIYHALMTVALLIHNFHSVRGIVRSWDALLCIVTWYALVFSLALAQYASIISMLFEQHIWVALFLHFVQMWVAENCIRCVANT